MRVTINVGVLLVIGNFGVLLVIGNVGVLLVIGNDNTSNSFSQPMFSTSLRSQPTTTAHEQWQACVGGSHSSAARLACVLL